MRPADEIKEKIGRMNFTADEKVRQRMLEDILEAHNKTYKEKPVLAGPCVWRIIMKNRMIKFAAALILIIALLVGINQFGGSVDGSSVAFCQVLKYFQTFSYTFDLTLKEQQILEDFTMRAMVLELGRMRVDFRKHVGGVSSIVDFNTGRNLLLFHQNKVGVIKKEPFLNKNTGAGGIASLCTKPVESLWNLRDGTETPLGEQDIDGKLVTGFRIFQEDQYFEYEIKIWADFESGFPSLVETAATPLDKSFPSITWVMKNFDLDVQLDEERFSLELPVGYTLGYEEDLERMEVETEPSDESQKIVQMLELWSGDEKDAAVEVLLEVDWSKQLVFGKEPYVFSLSEKGYISLKAEDQKQAMEEIMSTASVIREIVKEASSAGKTAMADEDYESAALYFEAAFQLGNLLARDPESMVIVRLIGIAAQKLSSKEMIELYTVTGNQEKLRFVEERLLAAEAETARIKKQMTGQ